MSGSSKGKSSKDDDLFNSVKDERSDGGRKPIRLRYAFADVCRIIWRFFTGEPKGRNDDDKYERQFIADAMNCNPRLMAERLEAQKIVNGTFARRRLEKWVTRIIVCYLAIVAALAVADGIVYVLSPQDKKMFSDAVLITILSTTTVNILGMAFIVLKGHFGGKDAPARRRGGRRKPRRAGRRGRRR